MEAAKLSEIKPVVAPRGGTKWHKTGVPLVKISTISWVD